MLDSLLQYDSSLFLRLNGLHTPWWDITMFFFTRKETWIPFYLILLVVFFRNYRNKGWIVLLLLVTGLIACDQLSGGIKEVVQRLRPGHDPALQNLAHIVLQKGGMYGFISSHAANSFYVLTFTGLIFRNSVSFWPVFSWALLVSWSRIYVGAHFPLDVVGGWFTGILMGLLFYKLVVLVETGLFYGRLPRIENARLTNQNAVLVMLTLAVIATTALAITYILHKYNLV